MKEQTSDPMGSFRQTNQSLCDAYTDIHKDSAAYDLAAFKAGQTTLSAIELEELAPEVDGKTMLHLQCHFGRDSMMWARMGAKVTGVDFSSKAIALARELNVELGLDCRFVEANVLDMTGALDEQFDIVFTSYGVLTWLDDLEAWARTVARHLKPGGVFYIVEFHPIGMMLNDASEGFGFDLPYFRTPEPHRFVNDGSYAGAFKDGETHPAYEWTHPMSEIVSALGAAGLQIEYLHEFDFSIYPMVPWLEGGGEEWHIPAGWPQLPLMFSIRATKS
ncbi:MAG: class I SAM-dependent methyltransferase [Anaerolineae bacterium]|nr:MAG: class I SAM-dependent methyltransferase [Anaerolineae bacterium]